MEEAAESREWVLGIMLPSDSTKVEHTFARHSSLKVTRLILQQTTSSQIARCRESHVIALSIFLCYIRNVLSSSSVLAPGNTMGTVTLQVLFFSQDLCIFTDSFTFTSALLDPGMMMGKAPYRPCIET